jgi:methionyl-tRNA formyltransferase
MKSEHIKIGILGSRKLAATILYYIHSTQMVDIIGCVAPSNKKYDDFVWAIDKLNISLVSYEELFNAGPDIIFSINYWKRIPFADIEKIPLGIVNLHHSYLLKYKGRYSTSHAILNARRLNCWEHGTTIHYIDEKLDEGYIIDSAKCPIFETDTAEILFERVENLSVDLFKRNFIKIINGKITRFLEADEDSFFYGKESNKDLEIKPNTSIENIYDFIRAWSFKDCPKPYILLRGKKIELSIQIKAVKVIYLAYRDWALAVYPTLEKHPKVSECVLCKTSEELSKLDLNKYDLIISCGWSEELGEKILGQIEAIGVHCAELDRYSYGTPIQFQILDGITRTKHRIFSFTFDKNSNRAHTHNHLYAHEIDLDLSGNMNDISEQLTATNKVLFTQYLDDYPNIQWRQWDKENIIREKRKPQDSILKKDDLLKMNTEQLYDFFRSLEDPYSNGCIEDEKGWLYIKKVGYKKK